jgi:hypothetical protein
VAKALDKPLVWLHTEIKSPPLSPEARIEAGVLLRRLQRGDTLSLPQSRPMQSIGKRCHELRIVDKDTARVIYRNRFRSHRGRWAVQQKEPENAGIGCGAMPNATAPL